MAWYYDLKVVTSLAKHLSKISEGSSIKSFRLIKEKEAPFPINSETDPYVYIFFFQ